MFLFSGHHNWIDGDYLRYGRPGIKKDATFDETKNPSSKTDNPVLQEQAKNIPPCYSYLLNHTNLAYNAYMC